MSPPFAAVLRSARPELNAQFAHARQQLGDLDGGAFSAFLTETVDPWVVATAEVASDAVSEVARSGFEVGLELVGRRLAGPGALDPAVEEGLRRLLPAAARVVASAPTRAITAFANGLYQLATTPGARLADWTTAMTALAAWAADLEELLRAGQLAAWRAGLAHFRAGALTVGDTLPDELALTAVGAGPDGSWEQVRRALAADPWFVPGEDEPGLRVARTAGAFRGLGGLFPEPPRVIAIGGELLVTSGSETWVLYADAFGATFHRANREEAAAARPGLLPAGAQLAPGTLTWNGTTLPLPTAGEVTSIASLPSTLALTFDLSHTVVLVASGISG